MKKLEVPTTSGIIEVSAFKEPRCVNLCVTMTQFGLFEVTHIHSGRKLFGGFERAVNAIREMIALELCLIESGIDQPLGMEAFIDSIKNTTTKFERLSEMTPLQHIKQCSLIGMITSEFPWEDENSSPFVEVDKLRKELSDA